MANLTAIQIGRHLERRGDAYWLHFEPDELKDRRGPPLDVPLPTALSPFIDRYLTAYRPTLLHARHSDRLWISTRGSDIASQAIYQQVNTVTEARLGHAINPHLFRDCAATSIAIDDPEHIEIVARILGHRTLKTGQRHYIQAKMLDASRQYGRILLDLRRTSTSRVKPQGTGGGRMSATQQSGGRECAR